MSFKIKTKRTSTGVINKLPVRIKRSGFVEVGVVAPKIHKGADGPLTVATVAAIHEFGLGNNPERSFLRSTVREEKARIKKMSKDLLKKIVKGKLNTNKGLGVLGTYLAGKVQEKIVKIKIPKNEDSTVLRKGSSNPLIDTGQLLQSITHKVGNGKLR